jgi:hypothetical protein
LQGYIELGFIAHPEVSSVVVEHLIQTRVPMAMHEALTTDMVGLKASVKAAVSKVEKLESRMARQEDPRDDDPKLLKAYHVPLEAVIEPALPDADKKLKGCCYSLTVITSGEVKKREFGLKRKTCGIFAKDWPEWLTVEGAFALDLEWVCLREAKFVANLVRIYSNTTFIMWKPEKVLPEFCLLFPMVAAALQQDMALRGARSFVGVRREV